MERKEVLLTKDPIPELFVRIWSLSWIEALQLNRSASAPAFPAHLGAWNDFGHDGDDDKLLEG